jgi:Glycosyltransferase family 28 C-terminal domain
METKTNNVLIIPGGIRSHVIPSFFIASKLRETCTIYYLVETEALAGLVKAQGFTPVLLKTSGIGYSADYQYIIRKHKTKSQLVKGLLMAYFYITNRLYKKRKAEIDEIVQELNPRAVFIDIFNIPNYIFFHSWRSSSNISLFSPMLSTYKANGIPAISEGSWNNAQVNDLHFLPSLRKLGISGLLDYWSMLRCCRKAGISRTNRLRLRPFTTYYFDNVPELVLGPVELELAVTVRQPNQYYLGLCTTGNRVDTKPTGSFEATYFRQMRVSGKKIVYCSFGTFFGSFQHNMAVTRFITNVIEAFADEEGIELIIASNPKVLTVLEGTLPKFSNVHLFEFVPQLLVLKQLADVFITHGGLGSVKESIEYGVPMLVCPVDLQWDQNGNGLKVATHGLGLQGILREETPESIIEKINQLLAEPQWKESVVRFAKQVKAHYNQAYIEEIFSIATQNRQHPAA